MLKRVNAWLWQFGHSPPIARLNVIGSFFTLPICAWILWNSYSGVRALNIFGENLPINGLVKTLAWMTGLTALCIIFDLSLWRAAFGKTKAPA